MSGCAGSCCSSAPICPCRVDQNPQVDSLPHVVGCFQSLQAGLYAEQAYYASLPTLQAAVIDAAQALSEENGLRPGNPPEFTQTQLNDIEAQLTASVDKISKCQRFNDLYTVVVDAIGNLSIPETAVYDTALRIALHTGDLPEQIRIHDGNRSSITALCDAPVESGWLDLSLLPSIFQQLSAAEAELCLSTCRQKICGFIAIKP